MKTIYRKDYQNDGVLINLDTQFIPFDNLLNNHNKYLNKNNKYYFYCKKVKKLKKVTSILEAYGYNTTLVL